MRDIGRARPGDSLGATTERATGLIPLAGIMLPGKRSRTKVFEAGY